MSLEGVDPRDQADPADPVDPVDRDHPDTADQPEEGQLPTGLGSGAAAAWGTP
jgi:hypothetical protein